MRLLLRGSREISAVGPIREFEKAGGLSQALTDFYKVSRTEVKEFQTPNGVMKFLIVRSNIKTAATDCMSL